MYIPDPIERAEEAIERWADNNIINEDFICSCGKLCRLIDGQTIDSNPYAIPICPECFDEWCRENNVIQLDDKDKKIQELEARLLQINFDLVRAGKIQEKMEIKEQQLLDEIEELQNRVKILEGREK